MKIAVIDESAARAAVIEEGLREAGLTNLTIITSHERLARRLEELAPDVVLMNLQNPSRDTMEECFAMSRVLARPVAMFVDQSDSDMIEAAIDAGVSAYVVDGLKKERVRSVLELAIRRFEAFNRLRTELEEAKTALADRKAIDRAKLILMKKRGLSEEDAYGHLRKSAMNNGRRLADVAQAIVTADQVMGGL